MTAASATAVTDGRAERPDRRDRQQPICRAVAGWMMHQLVANKIRKLKDGDGQYFVAAVQPGRTTADAVGLAGPHQQFYGLEVLESGNKTVLFGFLEQIQGSLGRADSHASPCERFAEYDQEGFLGFMEADGILLQPGRRQALGSLVVSSTPSVGGASRAAGVLSAWGPQSRVFLCAGHRASGRVCTLAPSLRASNAGVLRARLDVCPAKWRRPLGSPAGPRTEARAFNCPTYRLYVALMAGSVTPVEPGF